MKSKVFTVVLAIALLAFFTGTVYAQASSAGPGANEQFLQKYGKAKAMGFEGTVLSHDVGCHCLVLKTAQDNLTVQDDYAKFEGDYDRAKGVRIGSKVKGTYKTVDHIHYALEIQKAD